MCVAMNKINWIFNFVVDIGVLLQFSIAPFAVWFMCDSSIAFGIWKWEEVPKQEKKKKYERI